jgi:hypothetical protein
MEELPRGEVALKKLKAKLTPSRLVAVLEAVDNIRYTRHTAWLRVMFRINDGVRGVLDKRGVVGTFRVFYYDFSKTLWKFLSRYQEDVWDRYIDAIKKYYVDVFALDPAILDEVADATTKVIRQIYEELEKLEAEKRGGKRAEADNTE